MQGQAIYDALKNNPNLTLMLCGHTSTEARRSDLFEGRTVHSLLSDYQFDGSGGSGWMRLLECSPAANQIRVKTFSPYLNAYQTDEDSQFTLSYDLSGSGFTQIKTKFAASGSTPAITWSGLKPNTEYEWYVTVSDGLSITTSPIWKFKTRAR